MKKIIPIVIVVMLIMSFFIIKYSRYKATYEYDNNDSSRCILYDNDSYVEWTKIADIYCASGVINNTDMSPYFLISENLRDKVYISENFIQDLLPPYSYFSFCGESNDFIFESPDDTSLNLLYVKEGFVFPDISKNKVDEIWMSLSSSPSRRSTRGRTSVRSIPPMRPRRPGAQPLAAVSILPLWYSTGIPRHTSPPSSTRGKRTSAFLRTWWGSTSPPATSRPR